MSGRNVTIIGGDVLGGEDPHLPKRISKRISKRPQPIKDPIRKPRKKLTKKQIQKAIKSKQPIPKDF